MPFNKELEDFAQAFSTGYGMTKSREEREAEKLDLQHKQFLVDRDPITAGQQDELHDVEMQLKRGEITDAEAARRQKAILDPIAVQQAQESLSGTKTTNEYNRLKLGHLPTELEQADAQAASTLRGTEAQAGISELNLKHLPTEQEQADAQAAATLTGTNTTNEYNRLKLGNLPTELAQGNKLTGLQITGAEQTVEAGKHAVDRRKVLEPLADRLATAQVTSAEQTVAANNRAELREVIDNKHKDAMAILEEKHAKNLITNDEYIAQRNIINDKHTDAINALDEAIKTHDASPEVLAAKDKLVQTQTDAARAQIEESGAQVDKLKAETVPLLFRNNVLNTVERLRNRGSQSPDAPAEAVDPSVSGPRVRGPVIPSLQPKTPSWNSGPQSAVDVPEGSTISTHDDESEGITKGSKSSASAKTMRKLKNGEIPSMGDYLDVGTEVLIKGAKASADDAGIHKDEAVSTPGSELNFSNWLSGAHGADHDTAQMVIDSVKEASNGTLSPQEELLTASATGYLGFSLAGMPDQALGFAKGMQGYAQQLFGQYAAFAKAAAANGDIDATTMSIMKSYMNIGNGKSLDIKPDPKHEGMFIASIKDLKTGKVEQEHVVTPEEIVGRAMGVTPGTSMEILNAAAGDKDETISDAAARVLAAEYKDYGLTAEEISRMTTAEFEKVQERLEKDITAHKPKEYTLADGKEATAQIDDVLEKFKESNPDQYKALKLDDPKTGTVEDLLPAASQILLFNSENGMLPRRALRAAINLVVDGPSEPVMELRNGKLLVTVAGVDPFVMDANEYTLLTANRRKYGVPTASGLPEDAQRYEVGGQGAVSTKPAAAAPTTPKQPSDMGYGWQGPPGYWDTFFNPTPVQIPAQPPPVPSRPPERDYYPRG